MPVFLCAQSVVLEKREAQAQANRAHVYADERQQQARRAATQITKDPFQTTAETIVRAYSPSTAPRAVNERDYFDAC